ncbi:hypothetical protein AX17_005659 [Amanita inopinata Kibby_2008]|nr:hypothetical protein AX17_005659 [Amanita inopinata Kibby_2008]
MFNWLCSEDFAFDSDHNTLSWTSMLWKQESEPPESAPSGFQIDPENKADWKEAYLNAIMANPPRLLPLPRGHGIRLGKAPPQGKLDPSRAERLAKMDPFPFKECGSFTPKLEDKLKVGGIKQKGLMKSQGQFKTEEEGVSLPTVLLKGLLCLMAVEFLTCKAVFDLLKLDESLLLLPEGAPPLMLSSLMS